jgi:hypothetical protein
MASPESSELKKKSKMKTDKIKPSVIAKLLDRLSDKQLRKIAKLRKKKDVPIPLGSDSEDEPHVPKPVEPQANAQGPGYYPDEKKERRAYLQGRGVARSVVKRCHTENIFRINQTISKLTEDQVQQYIDLCLRRTGYGNWDPAFFRMALGQYKKGLKNIIVHPTQVRHGEVNEAGERTVYTFHG